MRYTTVIDIRDYPDIYRNTHARLVYLHLALKAGYHDIDRDMVDCSIRGLAADVGITVSAARHALHQLERARLLTRCGEKWQVTKWCAEGQITPRAAAKRKQEAAAGLAAAVRQQEERDRAELVERQRREQLAAQGLSPIIIDYETKVRLAEAGDVEAAKTIRGRFTRQAYEADCRRFGRSPLNVEGHG